MKEELRYYFFTYVFRDGENEYTKQAVIGCGKNEGVEKIINENVLSDMFGDETEEVEEGEFYNFDGTVCVSVNSWRAISKKEFNVLKTFLSWDIIKPKAEKVSFT